MNLLWLCVVVAQGRDPWHVVSDGPCFQRVSFHFQNVSLHPQTHDPWTVDRESSSINLLRSVPDSGTNSEIVSSMTKKSQTLYRNPVAMAGIHGLVQEPA